MMKKHGFFLVCSTLLFVFTLIVPVKAIPVQGGNWVYGGHHDIMNWGAFSQYDHPSRRHWSSVKRGSDGKRVVDYAGADAKSYAFINTSVGEYVDFDFGFY